jgi:hypothetical protein
MEFLNTNVSALDEDQTVLTELDSQSNEEASPSK